MILIKKEQCTVGREVFMLTSEDDVYDSPFAKAVIVTAPNDQDMVEVQRIQFDFGEVEKVKWEYLHVIPSEDEESELEKEFKKTYDLHWAELDHKVKQLAKLEKEVIALSEKSGLPFRMGRSYMPRTFYDKFNGIAGDFVDDLTNACGDSVGWQHSQVC